jgi:O-acetyl-ADP-ribose deacetylase (regulator of RNase III)
MSNSTLINDIPYTFAQGFAIDQQNIDAVINSANNGLLLGQSGAGRIRAVTGFIPKNSEAEREFYDLCSEISSIGGNCLRWQEFDIKKDLEAGLTETGPTYVQLECLLKILNNGSKALDLGEARLTTSGNFSYNLDFPKFIIHAVGMGYTWPSIDKKGDLIPATEESVYNSTLNSMKLARQFTFSSIAMPLMCVRSEKKSDGSTKVYGLTPEQSFNAMTTAVKDSEYKPKQIIFCADNKSSVAYFQEKGFFEK